MSEPGIEAKVAFLRRPEAYPDRPRRVEALETHMSWVFLTDRHAYKLKKPIRYDSLDFSSRELRRLDCEAEVRLNGRLAREVYLGTVALTLAPQGTLTLDGAGITYSAMSERIRSAPTPESCCAETTTVRTRLGTPHSYSTVTWVLPSGRR